MPEPRPVPDFDHTKPSELSASWTLALARAVHTKGKIGFRSIGCWLGKNRIDEVKVYCDNSWSEVGWIFRQLGEGPSAEDLSTRPSSSSPEQLGSSTDDDWWLWYRFILFYG